MQLVYLGKGDYCALVDDEDYERVTQYKWTAVKGKRDTLYASAFIKQLGTSLRMHSFITGWNYVDHIDSDGLNNQRENLRQATPLQNAANQRPNRNTSSKHRGVYWAPHVKRWRVQFQAHGKKINLGYFDSEDEAAVAWNIAAQEQWGEYAYQNEVR